MTKLVPVIITVCLLLTSCSIAEKSSTDENQSETTSSAVLETSTSDSGNGFNSYKFKDEMTYYLYIPEKSDNPQPLIIAFHGAHSGYTSVKDLGEPFSTNEAQDKLGGAYILIPKALENGFTDAEFITELIENVISDNPNIDTKRIFVIGHSQGAKFACELMLFKPELYKAACLSSCFYEMSDDDADKLKDIHFWFETSTDDDIYFYSNTRNCAEKLENAGADVLYKEFTDRGHVKIDLTENIPEFNTNALDWVAGLT